MNFSTGMIYKVSFGNKLFNLKFSAGIFFKRSSHQSFLMIRDVAQGFSFE